MPNQQASGRYAARLWDRAIAAVRHSLDVGLGWLQTVLERARGLQPRLELKNLPVVGGELRSPATPAAGVPVKTEPSTPVEVREHVLQLLKPGIAELDNALRRDSAPGPKTSSETNLAGTPIEAKPEPIIETKGQK
ncbi:MAG TPA: hypothetical protein VI455_02965 [Terriglobia bacterium]